MDGARIMSSAVWVLAALTCVSFAASGAFVIPDGAMESAKAALAHFLPTMEEAPERFGFRKDEDLRKLELGEPIPVTKFDVAKLSASQNLDDAAALLNPVKYAWFPVSLGGRMRGVITIVRAKEGNKWLPESFSKQGMAGVLEVFLKKYPSPKYQLAGVYAPSSQDMLLIVNGLGYNNLTAVPEDEATAQKLAEQPPRASVVLSALKANLDTSGPSLK